MKKYSVVIVSRIAGSSVSPASLATFKTASGRSVARCVDDGAGNLGAILAEVSRTDAASPDILVIDAHPTTAPQMFAGIFSSAGDHGHDHAEHGHHDHGHDHGHHHHDHDNDPAFETLSEAGKLDALVTVVDAPGFFELMVSDDTLTPAGSGDQDGEEKNVSEVLVDQIECADLIVIAGANAAGKEASSVEAFVRLLNPQARIERSEDGAIDLDALQDSTLFEAESTLQGAGWMRALQGKGVPTPVEGSDVGAFLFKARRPFHPGRFWTFVSQEATGLLRSKGFLWLATRPDFIAEWSQAGNGCQIDAQGTWWVHTPASEWPEDKELHSEIMSDWHETLGDKRQEVVFFGRSMDEAKVRAGLEGCLLTPSEFARPEADWVLLEDPFPVWEVHAAHDDDDHEHVHGPDCDHGHDHADHDHAHHDHDCATHERVPLTPAEAAANAALDVAALDALVAKAIAEGRPGTAIPLQEIRLRKTTASEWAALAMGRFLLASLLCEVTETHRALPLYREAIRALEVQTAEAESTWMLADVIHSYGLALVSVGEFARALEVFARGQGIAASGNQKAWESQFSFERGKILAAAGESEVALVALTEARNVRQTLGDPEASNALEPLFQEVSARVKAQSLRSKLKLDF